MSFKNRENNAWDQMAEAITKDLSRHRDDRVLIHTVSYGLADHLTAYLSKKSGRKFITYRNAQGRVGALAEYLDTPASVLIAPSMGRGVDLPGDACRVQMISKVPFPYLKDRQVSMRMHSRGGQLWYSVQTVRTIVQMCGRAIRSKDDWAVTYIYDRDFQSNLWRKSRNLFPKWFQEAIVWREGMG
jgi:Rad3-related DNA helicase